MIIIFESKIIYTIMKGRYDCKHYYLLMSINKKYNYIFKIKSYSEAIVWLLILFII